MNESEIFARAIEISSGADRERFLNQACDGNLELRRRIEVLLVSEQQTCTLLDQPLNGNRADPDAAAAGQLVGAYKLVRELGHGGMGTVWQAEQNAPVVRQVAVKFIKPHIDSGQFFARLEAERQALAILSHPHIAKMLDAGADQRGRPYFVMELVSGPSITEYCNAHRLTLRERLRLFVPVCQAVQHAHQKGLIHRDLKPSNVLIHLQDGRPAAKVIDFGIAKALGEPLLSPDFATVAQQILGTPEYMSPEQADFDVRDVDTRSDIYSLGVMLYELVTGDLPVAGRRDRLDMEVFRRIREDEPALPSLKIAQADNLPSLAAQRDVEPAKLKRQVQGEIDWILLKALKKDRNARYSTAQAFADDLESYLEGQPIQAGPDSLSYRLRKLVQRHRTAFAAAVAIAATLIVATVVSTSLSVELYRALSLANRNGQRAETNFDTAANFAKDFGRQRLKEGALDVAALALLEAARTEYRQRLVLQPDDVKSLDALADASSMAAESYRQSGRQTEAIAAAHEAVDATRRRHKLAPDTQCEMNLAHRLEYAAIVDGGYGEKLAAEALTLRKRLQSQLPDTAGLAFSLFLSEFNAALDLSNAGKPESALAAVKRALEHEAAIRAAGPDDDVAIAKLEGGWVLQADLLYRLNQRPAAEGVLQAAAERLRQFIGAHPNCIHCRGALAFALNRRFLNAEGSGLETAQDELAARRGLAERRLQETAWQGTIAPLIDSHFNVGFALCSDEKFDAAREQLVQADHLCRIWSSPERMPPGVRFRQAEVWKWLAEANLQVGRFEDAMANHLAGISLYEQLSAGDPRNLNFLRDLALLRCEIEKPLEHLGKREEGVRTLLQSARELEQIAQRDPLQATQNDFGPRWRPICLYFSAAAYARAFWRMSPDASAETDNVQATAARSHALRVLQAALDSGFDNPTADFIGIKEVALLIKQEDWTGLRNDKELLAILTAPAKSK